MIRGTSVPRFLLRLTTIWLVVNYTHNMNIKRMWINQPSGLQPLRNYHGENVLANFDDTDGILVRVYPVKGPVISMNIPKNSLSPDWIGGLDNNCLGGKLS